MSELQKFLDMIVFCDIKYTVYYDKKYMCDKAIRYGAVRCICIRDNVDIYFDVNGKFIGSATNSKDSFIKRKGIKLPPKKVA
jgi:hypothetical protein